MDKYTIGIVSGIIGWITTFLWNYPANKLGLSDLKYSDFVAVLIYGHFAKYTLEEIFALGTTIMWFAALGVLFSYITGNKHLTLKGLGFGVGVWFASYTITLLFKIPELTDISLGTAFSNLVGSLIYGLTLGIAVRWLRNKHKVNS